MALANNALHTLVLKAKKFVVQMCARMVNNSEKTVLVVPVIICTEHLEMGNLAFKISAIVGRS